MWCKDCGKEIEHGYEYDERFPLCKKCVKVRELHDEREGEDDCFEEDYDNDTDRED